MKLRLLSILLLVVTVQIGQTQTKKAFLKAAAEKFDEKDYYSALTFYGNALEFDSTDLEVRYQLAESAVKFNAYTTAAANYSYLLDVDTLGAYPDASLKLGQMWMMLGNYDEATNLFNIYMGEHSGESEKYDSIAQSGLEAADYAKDKIQEKDESVTINRLPDGINTPFSEFGARVLGESLFYSSHSVTDEHVQWGDVLLGRVLESTDNSEGEVIDLGSLYSNKSVANAAFAPDSMIILSVCDYVNPDELRCDLYSTTFGSDTTFSAPIKLPINVDTATTTQPFIMVDGDGKKYLFFVSDRDGGEGELDIYYTVHQQENLWTDPINVRSINTAGNDITPAYNEIDGRLYWSTDGRLSLGGYDVYSARRQKDNDFDDIFHLDAPVNSSYNDIYYAVEPAGEKAYFSSNRTGSLFIDPGSEACCYDIYESQLDIIRLEMIADTYDKLTGDSLTGVQVDLYDAETLRLLDTKTNKTGKGHRFELVQGRKYLVVSSKDGYFTDSLEVNTTGIEGPIKKDIYLDSDRYALDAYTFNRRTGSPLLGTTVRLIDVTDASIADIVQINDDGNDYLFLLEPGKQYRIEASKDGFITETAEISTIGGDVPKRIKVDLYLDSFDLNQHLPVSLYFDNDRPNPGSRSTSTDKAYSDLYYNYIEEEASYKRRNPSEKGRLSNFFESDVKGGYVQMQLFYDELFKAMESDEAIELTIKGHTSPLAVSKYNLVLGQRRVESVKNDLAIYRGGILRQYVDNGQIIITDISYGEEIAKGDASDSISNKRSSIYSVDAAKERRVEIIKATKQK